MGSRAAPACGQQTMASVPLLDPRVRAHGAARRFFTRNRRARERHAGLGGGPERRDVKAIDSEGAHHVGGDNERKTTRAQADCPQA